MKNWTKQEAKEFMVSYHMLNSKKELFGHNGIKSVFSRLQSIQYDPLDVVGRNADLVLQARVKDYKRNQINDALYNERYLIDGWDKMMGIYLTKDFHLFDKVREWRTKGELNTLKNRKQLHALDYVDDVLEILKKEPTLSASIKFGESSKKTWGQSKPSAATFDYLFHKGVIGVSNRRNTQKIYDLIENLIPKEILEESSNLEEDIIEYYLLRRIRTMGLVWNKSGVHWSAPEISKKTIRTKYIARLLEKELITEVQIEGVKELFYIPTDALSIDIHIDNKTTLLAPLDNFLWDRDLIKTIFGFDYKWEVYTPIVQRKYGYYVLPILRGCELVGRIEFEKHRNNDELIVKNIWWEDDHYIEDIQETLNEFKEYLGAENGNT